MSTVRTSSAAPSRDPGPSTATSLARCVGGVNRFLTQHWARSVHLHGGGDFSDLLSLGDVDRILSTMALRLPAFRLVKDGRTLDPSAYVRSGRVGSKGINDLIDVGRVYAQFHEGATIVLQGLQRYWEPLARFCRDLELFLTQPVQANAYITPPEAHGLRVHHDSHDVFALQTFGHKRWVTYPAGSDGAGDPTLDVELAPGDCLYVPKGVPHAARTVEATSLHITIGVRASTWQDVVRHVLDQAVDELALQEPLPVGFAHDGERFAELVAVRLEALARWVRDVDPQAVGTAMSRRFWSTRTPLLDGQLEQLVALDALSDSSCLTRRPGSVCALDTDGERLTATLGDRQLRLPLAVEPALRLILQRPSFVVADLGEYLDEPSRLVLARRLVREGLLMVVRA
ncbi:MAG: cupin domain-containing protein [Actinomycetota bacterium]|nr:cupin domain-containing protein [Actinomycetota bacterium]